MSRNEPGKSYKPSRSLWSSSFLSWILRTYKIVSFKVSNILRPYENIITTINTDAKTMSNKQNFTGITTELMRSMCRGVAFGQDAVLATSGLADIQVTFHDRPSNFQPTFDRPSLFENHSNWTWLPTLKPQIANSWQFSSVLPIFTWFP